MTSNKSREGVHLRTDSSSQRQCHTSYFTPPAECTSRLGWTAGLDIDANPHFFRKTSIICTIGPNTNSPEMIVTLREAGMNIVRLNFSHGSHEVYERNNNFTTHISITLRLLKMFARVIRLARIFAQLPSLLILRGQRSVLEI